MASDRDTENSSEVVEKSKISESFQRLLQQDVALSKDARLCVSLPLISSSGNGPNGNQGPTNRELVSDGMYHPSPSRYGYFAGSDGLYSNLENQAYLTSQGAFEVPYSVYHPARQVLSRNSQRQEQHCQGQGIGSFRLSSQVLMNNSRDKMAWKFNRNGGFDVCNELTRGPRANRKEGSSSIVSTENSVGFLIRRDKYNLEDFQITYEKANFFMIKSFSEDDIRKSIKYNVWSSTPNGNKKLDAAFREAEARAKESMKCPIFLFFSSKLLPQGLEDTAASTLLHIQKKSTFYFIIVAGDIMGLLSYVLLLLEKFEVNTSGQFVGLAQMIGPVDFTKSMDFWQQDKWHGFFPVKWHIVKDIPNILFRDIILENNENKAVTRSRDTQEIGLPQGLKMLQIFKTFQVQTSILDDFGFYEKKQKSLHAQRRTSEHSRVVTNCDGNSSAYPHPGRMEFRSSSDRTPSFHKESLVTLTKNLSLNAHRQSCTD